MNSASRPDLVLVRVRRKTFLKWLWTVFWLSVSLRRDGGYGAAAGHEQEQHVVLARGQAIAIGEAVEFFAEEWRGYAHVSVPLAAGRAARQGRCS